MTNVQYGLMIAVIILLAAALTVLVLHTYSLERRIDESINALRGTNRDISQKLELITQLLAEEPAAEDDEETDGAAAAQSGDAFPLTQSERRIIEQCVETEAGGESHAGKMLVAQCILNSCVRKKHSPSTVITYQYSLGGNEPSDDTVQAVHEVFDLGMKYTGEPIEYFYAPQLCRGDWHETQEFVLELGCHKFFKRREE